MKQRLFNPGPANTTDTVKQAMTQADICPRENEFGEVLKYICYELPEYAMNGTVMGYEYKDEYDTVLFGSSGTGAIESFISSLPKSSNLLIITNGAYGKRAATIASRYDINFSEIDFCDDVINYDSVKDEILRKKYDYVYTIHCETTTGILNDINLIGSYCKEAGSCFAVDAMSSFAAYEIDVKTSNISFLISSANKCLQGMAGISFIIAKIEELKKLKGHAKSYYFDMYDQWAYLKNNHQLRFTPPVQILYAMKQAMIELDIEGLKNRHFRYVANNAVLCDGMKQLGVKQYTPKEHASIIITSFYDIDHPNYSFEKMHDFLYERGITIYPGKVSSGGTFRIANIGTLTTEDVKLFLSIFSTYLERL